MASDTELYVIKGRLKSIPSNTYGLFVIILDKAFKKVEKLQFALSHFSTIYETPPQTSTPELDNQISMLKWRGEISSGLTNDVEANCNKMLQDLQLEEIIEAAVKNKKDDIQRTLQMILSKPTNDHNVLLDFTIEGTTRDALSETTEEQSQDGLQEAEEVSSAPSAVQFEIEEGAVLLPIGMDLAPVSGIPIGDLRSGHKIMVKIDPASPKGQFFIDQFGAKIDGKISAIPADVKKIVCEGPQFTVYCMMSAGVYGKSIEDEKVKVRRYNEALDSRRQTPSRTPTLNNPGGGFFEGGGAVWILGGLTLLLAIFVLLMIYQGW